MDKDYSFGQYLKTLRKKKGYGLRAFARELGVNPSNISKIESGTIKPPRSEEILFKYAEVLGLVENTEEWNRLFNLSVEDRPELIPVDMKVYSRETQIIPLLMRTIANKKLTREQIEQLVEEINKKY